MAYIKVDHSKFESAAAEIDEYVNSLKRNMQSANGEITKLAANWQGADFAQFNIRWNNVTNSESTYYKFINSLESYSKYLRYASQKYKDAQTRAVNRAESLPIY